MTDKIFLLGVGCQKGGTSWLHDYLSAHPQCNLGFRKEYHVFDAIFLNKATDIQIHREQRLKRLRNLLSKQQQENRKKPKIDAAEIISELERLMAFRENPELYARYFDELHAGSPGVGVVGDITPAYCGLSPEHFRYIRSLLEPRGFTVKALFLMRDPLERVYSSLRMKLYKRWKDGADQDEETVLNRLFWDTYNSPRTQLRTRYEVTVENLERAFDPDDVFFGFYESLFTVETVAGITGFLGIDYRQPEFAKKVNSTPRRTALSQDAVDETRRFYAQTYEFCRNRFGADTIARLWGDASTAPAEGREAG